MDWYGAATPEEQERLTSAWLSAPIEQAELCQMLLEVARDQVVAYAPAASFLVPSDDLMPDDDLYPPDLPTRFVYAQLQQAKNLWNAGRADENGNVGTEGFSFTPRPLDKTIRQIIRPMGRLSVG